MAKSTEEVWIIMTGQHVCPTTNPCGFKLAEALRKNRGRPVTLMNNTHGGKKMDVSIRKKEGGKDKSPVAIEIRYHRGHVRFRHDDPAVSALESLKGELMDLIERDALQFHWVNHDGTKTLILRLRKDEEFQRSFASGRQYREFLWGQVGMVLDHMLQKASCAPPYQSA